MTSACDAELVEVWMWVRICLTYFILYLVVQCLKEFEGKYGIYIPVRFSFPKRKVKDMLEMTVQEADRLRGEVEEVHRTLTYIRAVVQQGKLEILPETATLILDTVMNVFTTLRNMPGAAADRLFLSCFCKEHRMSFIDVFMAVWKCIYIFPLVSPVLFFNIFIPQYIHVQQIQSYIK